MARYYIAPKTGGPGGSAAGAAGNSGTFASPWDLQTAFNGGNPGGTVVPGDTLILRKGTYVGVFTQKNSGTNGNPVTITNYPADLVNWPQDLPTIDSNYTITLAGSMIATTSQTTVAVSDASALVSGTEVYVHNDATSYLNLGERMRVSGAPSGNNVTFIRALQSSPGVAHSSGETISLTSAAGYIEAATDTIVKNIWCKSTRLRRAIDWRRGTYDFGSTFVPDYNTAWPWKRISGFDVGNETSTSGTRSKYVHCVCSDGQQGFGWWKGAQDSEVWFTFIWGGGVLGPDRSHGHGLYIENETGVKNGYGIMTVCSYEHAFKAFGADIAVKGVHMHDGVFANSTIYALNANSVDVSNFTPGAASAQFTNASTTVTFSGVTTAALLAGDRLSPDGGTTWYTIQTITNSTDVVVSPTPSATATVADCLTNPGYDVTGSFPGYYATNNIAPNTDLMMERCAIFNPSPAPPGGEHVLGQSTANGGDLIFRDSVVDCDGFQTGKFQSLVFTGNVIVQRGTNINNTARVFNFNSNTTPPTGPITIDSNIYWHEDVTRGPYKTPVWAGNPASGNLTLAQWKSNWSAQGYTVDAASTDTGGSPTGTKVMTMLDPWERGRLHYAIYNWSLASTVSAAVPNLWLRPGDAYRIYLGEAFDQGPIATGVYNGSSITFPMTAVTPSTPFDFKDAQGNNLPPASMLPKFGAYIVMRVPG